MHMCMYVYIYIIANLKTQLHIDAKCIEEVIFFLLNPMINLAILLSTRAHILFMPSVT